MGGLFGETKSKASIPGYVEDASREMLQRSVDMGKTGYMPWSGPDVAALTPDQLAARENTNAAASAFGLNVGGLGTPGATDFGNGIWGHSSLPMYEQQMDYMQSERPGQLDYYNSFFVDPVTGVAGSRMEQEAQQGSGPTNTMDPREQQYWNDVMYGHLGGMAGETHQGQMAAAPATNAAGYTGLMDMFNGGGPGASGDVYQGGGLFSDFANRRKSRGGLFGGLF